MSLRSFIFLLSFLFFLPHLSQTICLVMLSWNVIKENVNPEALESLLWNLFE